MPAAKKKAAPKGKSGKGKKAPKSKEQEDLSSGSEQEEDQSKSIPPKKTAQMKKTTKKTEEAKKTAKKTAPAKEAAASKKKEKQKEEKIVHSPEKKKASPSKKEAAPKKKKATAKKQKDDEDEDDMEDEAVERPQEDWNASPPLEKGQIKIVSWNVAGFKAHQADIKDYLSKESPDIICFQETKVQNGVIPASAFPDYTMYFTAAAKSGQAGVAIFSKQKAISVQSGLGKDHDDEGRIQVAEFENFYLVNTYVPNSGQGLKRIKYRIDQWDKDLQKVLNDLQKKKPVIWCGDLNVAHKEADLKNPKTNKKTAGFTQQERDSFSNILEKGDFVDTWRERNPQAVDEFTFWSYKKNAREKNVGWRLDYFIISREFFTKNVTECYPRKYVYGSDHCPLVLHIKN